MPDKLDSHSASGPYVPDCAPLYAGNRAECAQGIRHRDTRGATPAESSSSAAGLRRRAGNRQHREDMRNDAISRALRRVSLSAPPLEQSQMQHETQTTKLADMSPQRAFLALVGDVSHPDAVFSTLRAITTLAPGTEIFFQYTVPKELCDEESQRLLAVVMAASAARGEPWQSSFEPVKLSEQVSKLGFAEVSDLGPGEARARFFADRTDGLRPSASEYYMRARVGPNSN
jgi:hypothetical protein